MKLRELLQLRGLPGDAKVKVVRHQDSRLDVQELVRSNQLEVYQAFQSKPVFDACDFVVSLTGHGGTHALLRGVFRVNGKVPASDHPLPPDFARPDLIGSTGFYYDLSECSGFDDLNSRVVVDWGKAAITWHQWLREDSDKEVVEVLPAGFVRHFPGYEDFVLSLHELRAIVDSPESNRAWHVMLGAVAGVYLIVDTVTGAQYVGSAYGQEGILGRWRSYAACGHGGNERLMEVCSTFPGRDSSFQFSILRTLPRTLTFAEVIRYENLYKLKLGTRAFGLNAN